MFRAPKPSLAKLDPWFSASTPPVDELGKFGMVVCGIWWARSSLSSLSSTMSRSNGYEACVTSAGGFGGRAAFLLGGIVRLFRRAREHGGRHCWDLNCLNRNHVPNRNVMKKKTNKEMIMMLSKRTRLI